MTENLNFSLRPATQDDIFYLIEIENRVHVAPWNAEHFQAELTKPFSHFLVLTDDETDSKIAGYLIYWLMLKECQILNIVIDLPYRGLGLAKQMLRKVIFLAFRQGLERVILEVRKSNQPAIQLYQSFNFFIVHVRKNFYSNGEDAYQMVLELKNNLSTF